MPVSKSVANGAKSKVKSLKVFEVVREGRIFWQTEEIKGMTPNWVSSLWS